jgi:hypothetical protein
MTDTLQTLAPALLQEFATELVNLPMGSTGSVAAFVRRFADFGLFEPRIITRRYPSPREAAKAITVPYLHQIFRAIWVEPNIKNRQWGAMILRIEWCQMRIPDLALTLRDEDGVKRIPPPPPETGVERALDFLLKYHHRTRYCPSPGCPAPYFFARRHSQRYGSEDCAQAAERETKRKWWIEHGTAWRKKRKKAAETSSSRRATQKKGRKGR